MRTTLFVAACGLVLALGTELRAADWPTFLGPNRDGCSPDSGLLKQWPDEGPKLVWKNESLGPGWSSVAVVGERVYTTGNEGENQTLRCIDNATGKTLWSAPQGPKSSHRQYDGARATPTVDGDRIYLTGGDGRLTCQSSQDGRVLWSKEMRRDFGGKVGGWQYAESPLVLDRLLVVTPGGDHPVVALDKATGATVWKSDKPATAGYSSCLPITRDGCTVIANGTQSGLLVIDAKTGKELYRDSFASGNVANTPTPAYADGHLFWAVGYNKGALCIRVGHDAGGWTFDEAWTSHDFTCHPGNYVVAQGCVYGKGKGAVVCADLKTGMTKWVERGGSGQIAWADGLLYSFADQGGKLALIDPGADTGRIKGRLQVAGTGNSWSHPVVVNGRLYLRYSSNLYCYDVRAK